MLSPHPDDAEYSLSGTILKFQDTKFQILNMSSGGDFDRADEERVNEVLSFWKDVPNVEVLGSRHTFIKETTEDVLVWWVEQYTHHFQAVFAPPQEDFHFEHRIVNSVGKALTRKRKVSFIEYNTPSTSHTWNPNLFVDVSAQYSDKKAKLQAFETQRQRVYFNEESVDSFHTNYFCNKRLYGQVEMFRTDFVFV